jgi:hypothetical protein
MKGDSGDVNLTYSLIESTPRYFPAGGRVRVEFEVKNSMYLWVWARNGQGDEWARKE